MNEDNKPSPVSPTSDGLSSPSAGGSSIGGASGAGSKVPKKNLALATVVAAVIALLLVGIIALVAHNNSDSKKVALKAISQDSNISQVLILPGSPLLPRSLTIHPGDVVVWINGDVNTHQITFDDGALNNLSSGPIAQNHSFSYVFTKAGTYSYTVTESSSTSSTNNAANLSGTIVVNNKS